MTTTVKANKTTTVELSPNVQMVCQKTESDGSENKTESDGSESKSSCSIYIKSS